MTEQQLERTPQAQHEAPEARGFQPPPQAHSEEQPAWAGSPETAAAKESVRREARTKLPDDQVDALAQEIKVETPSQVLAREAGGTVGSELIAEVAQQEEGLRRRAIGDAYQVVMAGAAVANGQPQAQQAVDAASPEIKQAAHNVAKDNPAGGAPLPDKTREKMEAKFGEDFSDVQVHTGNADVGALGAGAATKGTHIHFASGKFDPESKQGERLIAHELAHVVQQRGAGTAGKAGIAPSSAAAEHEAESVADKDGPVDVARGTAGAQTVHLGEATVHRGIELEAAGVGQQFDAKKLTPEQKAALEMYSGNFMRDYSQLAAPTPLKMLSQIPSANKGGVVGNAGARVLMDAIVQSIAILELGKDIGKKLVTQQHTGAYEAEHHIDNPIGTKGSNDFITEGANPHLAASPQPKAIRTVDARNAPVVAPNSTTDADTQSTHAGSAVSGLQYENPELYKIGDGGLANHISNSTEHSKDCFLSAVQLGASSEGRMRAGMGQHIVEDYFSHSNFIEVGLNSYINEAIRARHAGKTKKQAGTNAFIDQFADGKGNVKQGAAISGPEQRGVHAEFSFVDTLYDAKTKSGKQAITTGTFGGTDTQVSIGHVLLPKMPIIEKALHKGIDATFGIVDTEAKSRRKPTWEYLKQALDSRGNEGAVAQVMLEASKTVGLAVPCPSGFHLTYKEIGIPLFGKISVPNGMELSHTNISIADALVTGASTYVSVMETLDTIKRAAGIVGLESVIQAIQDQIQAAMKQLNAAVRAKVTDLLRMVIIEMYHLDPKKVGHAGVDELSHVAERQMHEMTDRTSIQSRMQEGGDLHGLTEQGDNGKAELERRVGPVRARDEHLPKATWGTKENPWVTVNPLPPSHSEISKDHPPHVHDDKKPDWHEQGPEKQKVHDGVENKLDEHHDPKHEVDDDEEHEDLSEGSTFYGLHRALAVEADRHIMKQLETCWHAQLIPGQNIDEDKMEVGHDRVLSEAHQVAGWAAEQRARAGFRHAQSDDRVSSELRGRPEVMQLLDLVDMFVSHPTSSLWWRTIFDNYLATHGDEVYKAILARNKTRSRRKAPT